MSQTERGSTREGGLRAAEVLAYLRSNPEFFLLHPELLEALQIPHECGNAVSLVEYQVTVLREQNHQLRRRLKDLVAHARENEELNQRLHRLTLALLECAALDELFAALGQSLREDFGADLVSVRVFARPLAPQDAGLGELLGADGTVPAALESVFAGAKPVCGRLRPEQASLLFGERAGECASAALVPLVDGAPLGVIGIGSLDPRRFHPGMGTVFLRQLGAVVARLVTPRVALDDGRHGGA